MLKANKYAEFVHLEHLSNCCSVHLRQLGWQR